MNKITSLFTMLSISIFAQQQFPGENENNLIINAGFEQAPVWKDCNDCVNDEFGWEGYLCARKADKAEIGTGTDTKVSVPSADGNYYAMTKAFEASIYQVIPEVEPNTQYTVRYKFGWIDYYGRTLNIPNDSGGFKEINAVITNNQTGANKVVLKKFSHRNGDYYSLGSEDNTFATAFFDSWNDIEWTFTTTSENFEVRLAMWKMEGTPPYILDNVEIFPTPEASINKFENAMFTFSPNPVNNVLNLKASKTISKVEFYNNIGQNVLASNVNALSSNVNISGLNKGIYLMNVTIDGQTQGFKILKQ